MVEYWKPVSGFEGLYEVSNFGRVKSLPRIREGVTRDGKVSFRKYKERVLSLKPSGRYIIVNLFKDKKEHPITLHRVVAVNFLPNPENYPEINHKDGNPLNNRVDNLEWIDRRGNALHSTRDLKKNIGGCHPFSILNEESVKGIVEEIQKGKTQSEVSSEYGVTRSAVSKIMTGKNWSHVTGFGEGGYQDVQR